MLSGPNANPAASSPFLVPRRSQLADQPFIVARLQLANAHSLHLVTRVAPLHREGLLDPHEAPNSTSSTNTTGGLQDVVQLVVVHQHVRELDRALDDD